MYTLHVLSISLRTYVLSKFIKLFGDTNLESVLVMYVRMYGLWTQKDRFELTIEIMQ